MEALYEYINQYYTVSKERVAEIIKAQNNKIIKEPLRIPVKSETLASPGEYDKFKEKHLKFQNWQEVKEIFKPEVVEFLEFRLFSKLFYSFLEIRNLRSNKFSFDIEYLPGKYINKDEKLSKVFKKVLREDAYNAIMKDYSEIRNQIANREQTLVISNKIVDFFTMSDNNYNWHSCMNWDYGEYRAGTLEMADSTNFLVAYLAGSKEYYPGIEDKKARFLIYADEKAIVPIKMYPYYNEELFKIAVDALVDHLDFKYEIKTYKRSEKDIYIYMNHFMYNDYISDRDFLQYAAFSEELINQESIRLQSDGRCKCLKCGEEVYAEDSLLCHRCSGKILCDKCGCWEDEGYSHTTADDYCVCEWCWDQATYDDGNENRYLYEENIEKPIDEK